VLAALADTSFVVLPLYLVFCLPVASMLLVEQWRAPFLLWCVASLVVGLPLGLLSGVLIGCGVLQKACL
jgi:ribose/xylose/arabinose/galactoside ABC-type transport system permease subunit